MFNNLKVKFPTLDSAEEFYNLTLSNCLEEMEIPGSRGNTSPKIMVDKVAQTEKTAFKDICTSGTQDTEEAMTPLIDIKALKVAISSLEMGKLIEITNFSFLELANKNGIDTNPADFASLSVTAMKRLQEHKKNNLIYKFSMCIGSNQPGTDDPLFPLTRMPFGLVEYQIEFFSATNIMQVCYVKFLRISIFYLQLNTEYFPVGDGLDCYITLRLKDYSQWLFKLNSVDFR